MPNLHATRKIIEVGFFMSRLMWFKGWYSINSYKPLPSKTRYVLGHL